MATVSHEINNAASPVLIKCHSDLRLRFLRTLPALISLKGCTTFFRASIFVVQSTRLKKRSWKLYDLFRVHDFCRTKPVRLSDTRQSSEYTLFPARSRSLSLH